MVSLYFLPSDRPSLPPPFRPSPPFLSCGLRCGSAAAMLLLWLCAALATRTGRRAALDEASPPPRHVLRGTGHGRARRVLPPTQAASIGKPNPRGAARGLFPPLSSLPWPWCSSERRPAPPVICPSYAGQMSKNETSRETTSCPHLAFVNQDFTIN